MLEFLKIIYLYKYIMMKMVFSDGLYRPRQISKSSESINNSIKMTNTKRESPESRFNMNQSMRIKKTGCRSCSGVH